MPLKIEPASAEEQAFAADVNRKLVNSGARVSVFSLLNIETQVRQYGVVFQLGSKRKTITADAPFHYDSPDDVISRVYAWIKGGAELYTPDESVTREWFT